MEKRLVLPFYVLADVSYSMTQGGADGQTPLDAVNEVAPRVLDTFTEMPLVKDKVQFSLLSFSDDFRAVIPLCDPLDLDHIPAMDAEGGTSFSSAFRGLKDQILEDTEQLREDNFRFHRPAVFFVTDGDPTDLESDWSKAFSELTDEGFKYRPVFIPFGVGEASSAILERLVFPASKSKLYMAKSGVSASDAIQQMIEILLSSIIASAGSINEAGEEGGFMLPESGDDDEWFD